MDKGHPTWWDDDGSWGQPEPLPDAPPAPPDVQQPASSPRHRRHHRHVCGEACERFAELLDDLAGRFDATLDEITERRRFRVVSDVGQLLTAAGLWPDLLRDAPLDECFDDPCDPVGMLDQTVDPEVLGRLTADEGGVFAAAVSACGGVLAAAAALGAWWAEYGEAIEWCESGESATEEWEMLHLATTVGLAAWSDAGRPGRLALISTRITWLAVLCALLDRLRTALAAAAVRAHATAGAGACSPHGPPLRRSSRTRRRAMTCRRTSSRREAGHAGAPSTLVRQLACC